MDVGTDRRKGQAENSAAGVFQNLRRLRADKGGRSIDSTGGGEREIGVSEAKKEALLVFDTTPMGSRWAGGIVTAAGHAHVQKKR